MLDNKDLTVAFFEPTVHDDEDIQQVVEDKTGDGPGDLENLPESDFEGFASDDAEGKATK